MGKLDGQSRIMCWQTVLAGQEQMIGGIYDNTLDRNAGNLLNETNCTVMFGVEVELSGFSCKPKRNEGASNRDCISSSNDSPIQLCWLAAHGHFCSQGDGQFVHLRCQGVVHVGKLSS